jgi:hypothetical protein
MKFLRVRMIRTCGALQAGHEYNIVRGDAERYIQQGDAESTEPTAISPAEGYSQEEVTHVYTWNRPETKIEEPKKESAKPKLKVMPKKAEHKAPAKKATPRKRA